MEHGNKRSVIKWTELSVSERWKKAGAKMAVHPVSIGEGRQCFALALDQRWLCGSDGALTFFDSRGAATRFLQLLNVEGYVDGEGGHCGASRRDPLQCFQLGTTGLKTCDQCRIGDESRVRALHDFAPCEECW